MSEKDPAQQIREEFPSVSPGSANAMEHRVGRRHHIHPVGSGIFKVHPQVYIEAVATERQGNKFDYGDNYLLGKNVINNIERARKYGRSPEDDDFVLNHIDIDKKRLLNRLNAEDWGTEYSEMVAARIIEEAKGMDYEFDPEMETIKQAGEFISGLDIEEFEQYLRFHIQSELKRFQRFDENFKNYKLNFLEKVGNAVEAGILPVNLDFNKVRSRINHTRLSGADLLRFMGSLGGFSDLDHDIVLINLINSDGQVEPLSPHWISQESQNHTLTHEGMHAIAGKGVLFSFQDKLENDPPTTKNVHKVFKSGLSFKLSKSKRAELGPLGSRRFIWLDEALTEKTTVAIEDYEKPEAYVGEIKLYELIRRKGKDDLDDILFLEAYFEDYDPDAPAGKRLPHWNKLRHAINDSYDSKFLIELDDYILAYNLIDQEEGVKKALEFMEGLEKGGYGHNNKTLQDVRAEKAAELGLDQKTSWKKIICAELAIDPHAGWFEVWEAARHMRGI
jgi:hypothetical protein